MCTSEHLYENPPRCGPFLKIQIPALPYTIQKTILPPPKKNLHNTDNHDDVINHLEPDILECKVKRALGSITRNTASGGDGIPVELFQMLKDYAVKVLHSICQQIWKIQQCGHRNIKGQFSFQFQRKAMPKDVQITSQLPGTIALHYHTIASHMLVK